MGDATNREISMVALGVALVLGLHMIYLNIVQYKRYSATINLANLVAAVCQFWNKFVFLLMFTRSASKFFHNQCFIASLLEGVPYYTFQILSPSVLIWRGTCLIDNPKLRNGMILVLVLILLAGTAFVVYADVLKTIMIVDDGCVLIFHPVGGIGKNLIAVVYLVLLFTFAYPLYKQIRQSRVKDAKLLKKILYSMAFRITLAILGLLITGLLNLIKFWTELFVVEFLLQDYFALLASTSNLEDKKDQGSDGVETVVTHIEPTKLNHSRTFNDLQ
jgi:hypothetical protein